MRIKTISIIGLALVYGLLLVSYPVQAQTADQEQFNNETKSIFTGSPFYDPNSLSIANPSDQCLGIEFPNITDPAAAAKAINEFIENFETRTGKKSPFHGLGDSFLKGGAEGKVNPFLSVAHLYHESGFATAPEGWHTTEPPSYNAFGRSATQSQPHTTYTTGSGRQRLVYKWNSWQDSLEGADNWFQFIRKVYLEDFGIEPTDLAAFISRYAPRSDGNNEEHYVKILKDTMQKLVTETGAGITCGVSGTGSGKEANIQLGQKLAAEAGWTGEEWTCLTNIWTQESQWSETADNPRSTAYGIPQALLGLHRQDIDENFPGYYTGDYNKPTGGKAEPQIRWGIKYIKGKYQTACKAWEYKQSKGTY